MKSPPFKLFLIFGSNFYFLSVLFSVHLTSGALPMSLMAGTSGELSKCSLSIFSSATDRVFYRMPSTGICLLFSHNQSGVVSFEKDCTGPSHCIKGLSCQQDLPVDIELFHLAKGASVRFLHCILSPPISILDSDGKSLWTAHIKGESDTPHTRGRKFAHIFGFSLYRILFFSPPYLFNNYL